MNALVLFFKILAVAMLVGIAVDVVYTAYRPVERRINPED